MELWEAHYSHGMSSSCGPAGATSSNYDVTADGSRFLLIRDDDQDRVTSKQIVVAQSWADELSRRVEPLVSQDLNLHATSSFANFARSVFCIAARLAPIRFQPAHQNQQFSDTPEAGVRLKWDSENRV